MDKNFRFRDKNFIRCKTNYPKQNNGEESNQENFEGFGFNYAPMKATQGPPGLFHTFSLEGPNPFWLGIKSCFGKYWRYQHWTAQVSQSSQFKGDEAWALTIHPTLG